VLPTLERGVFDRLSLRDADLALACASHDGTPQHTEAVRAFLARAGFDESDLGCGPHAPFDPEARRAMLAAGERPGRVHNNCSGKHTGFLCLQRDLQGALGDYLEPGSAAQQAVAASVAEMTGVDLPLPTGVDGCGAPTFQLPLAGLARAFAGLANRSGQPAVRAGACQRILAVAGQHPELVAGRRRLCTALLRALPGAVFGKNGAEGVYAVALAPDRRRRACPGAVGIAVKVDDGAERGYQPVIVDLLWRMGAFGSDLPADLERFWRIAIGNTRGAMVGEVRCVADWGQL
jgi:L-asparaginase II